MKLVLLLPGLDGTGVLFRSLVTSTAQSVTIDAEHMILKASPEASVAAVLRFASGNLR